MIDKPDGAFTGTDEMGVSAPVAIVKNCTTLEPVSATARIPSRVSISTAPGFVPAGVPGPTTDGGVVEKSGNTAMLVTDGLLSAGNGGVVRATDSGYRPGKAELTALEGRLRFNCREEDVEPCAKLLPMKVGFASKPPEPKYPPSTVRLKSLPVALCAMLSGSDATVVGRTGTTVMVNGPAPLVTG